MAISWAAVIVGALAVMLLFYLVVRVTLGAGRYGREFDQAARHRQTRVVDCPETDSPAAVVAQADASGRFQVKDCSRWTEEHRQCDQRCVQQIERAPDGCLVRTIVTEWCQGNACGICGKKIGPVNWFDFKPALLARDGTMAEWHEVPVDLLPDVLSTHTPVCRECCSKRR